MSIRLLFIHHREVRRFKTIEAKTVEDGEKLYQAFVESAAANGDVAWDEIEDDDPGESELREVRGKGTLNYGYPCSDTLETQHDAAGDLVC